MLTLGRRSRGKGDPQSQIVLRCACGETITMTVVKSGTCEVSLAFEAAKTVSIKRGELLLGEKPCIPLETP